jgi:capsular polysaccharide export protein
MNNVLYPLTYLGLCPFLIVLARALQTQKAFQPTFLAVTPAEAAFAETNLPPENRVICLAPPDVIDGNVLTSDSLYQEVYGFMKAKYGGSDRIWRQRVNRIFRVVESVILKRDIRMMVLWNGNDCMGKVCRILAEKHGLKTVFLENGYFPNTLQVDPKGVNAEASVAEVPASQWLTCVAHQAGLDEKPGEGQEKISPSPTQPLKLFQRLRLKLEPALDRKFYDRYPELRDQKLRKQVKTTLSLSTTASILENHRPFALVVLQVHDDTQILLNSRLFKNPRDFVQHCHDNIRHVFGPGFPIVVKLHPVDLNRICYAGLAARMPNTHWIGAEPVQPLLDACQFVMVVNSSVGLQSIALHKPTVVFGESFYSRDEVCRVVRTTSQTRQVLEEIKAGEALVDPSAIDQFLQYLQSQFFVKGSWKIAPDTDLAPAVQKIHQILAPAPQ